MPPVRSLLKRTLEAAFVRTGLPERTIRRREDIAVLAYHNVVPHGERPIGDRSLHISQRHFGDHLDRLLESHVVISLEDAFATKGVEGVDEPSGTPRAVLTFDDGYLGTLTAGVEELSKRELPATIFVNPGAFGWPGFWWDLLADPDTGILADRVRTYALESLGGRQNAVLAWARNHGLSCQPLPSYARSAPEAVLVASSGAPDIRFGSHSWSHPSLPTLSANELREELDRASDWLDDHLPGRSLWLSWPYGHSSTAAATLAGASPRIDGGLVLDGRRTTSLQYQAGPMQCSRINVPSGLSAHGLVLRLAEY